MGVGVVHPAVLGAVGDELGGHRVDAAVLGLPLLVSSAVEEHVELEALGGLPLRRVHGVGGGHPDGALLALAARAGVVARRAVQVLVPAGVGGEDVVDVDREVVAALAEVHPLGQPVDDAAGEQPELLLVLVVAEGDDQFAASVVGVLADERGASGTDRGVQVAGVAGPGLAHEPEALGDERGVVLEGDLAAEVGERAGLARGGDGGLGAVELAAVAPVVGVFQPDSRVGPGVGVDLADPVRRLVGGERGHLGRALAERVLVRQDDTLVLGARTAVHGVAEEARVDDRAAAAAQLDAGVGHPRVAEFRGDRLDRAAAVVDDQHLQVDARCHGRRGGRGGYCHGHQGGCGHHRRDPVHPILVDHFGLSPAGVPRLGPGGAPGLGGSVEIMQRNPASPCESGPSLSDLVRSTRQTWSRVHRWVNLMAS